MILSDRMIKAAIEIGDIVIDPFDPKALGTNSYDVHINPWLRFYKQELIIPAGKHSRLDAYCDPVYEELDCKKDNPTLSNEIGPNGFVLEPDVLYLASTIEYTRTRKYVPFLDGKSSVGRLGITIHCTAGRGDVGFAGHWTMEIHVVQPVRVYAGMPIGQLIYFETGEVDVPYDEKPGAKYRDGRNPEPQASKMWMNFK